MVNEEFISLIKNDNELQELRREVYAITGELKDISFPVGREYTLEEWKEDLKKIVKSHTLS